MASVLTTAGASGYFTKSLFVACIVNGSMGLLYVWSLFLLPLEKKLGIDRSILSIAPALALVTFTIGMAMHDRLLRKMSMSGFAMAAFGVAGVGHILFGLVPSIWALLAGYGLGFGSGAGLCYGLALVLATRTPDRVRSMSIGVAVAAFAGGGVVLSSVLASVIATTDPQTSFMVIGVCLLVIGVVVGVLLRHAGDERAAAAQAGATVIGRPRLLSLAFLSLAFSFFFICYVGLMVVSHVAAMLALKGLSPGVVGLGPVLFTSGYVIGSLLGGKLVESITGRPALILANVLGAAGLLILALPVGNAALAGTLVVGAVLGSSASFMPTLIGELYGSDQIGPVYGKLMISYGVAGLLAPWLTGFLYVNAGNYTPAFALGGAVCAAGVLVGLTMPRSAVRTAS